MGSTKAGFSDQAVVQQGRGIVGSPAFFFLFLANAGTPAADSLLYHILSSGERMSQILNFFTTTSGSSCSSTGAGSFNNNSNSFNTNVSNHFTAPEDRSEILAWLSPLEPRVRHQNLEAGRVEKVGDWLLQTEQFQRWWNGSSQGESQNATMFCYGNPGTGKTYIW